ALKQGFLATSVLPSEQLARQSRRSGGTGASLLQWRATAARNMSHAPFSARACGNIVEARRRRANVYFPVREDMTCYVVPDVESEQRILCQLMRIRFVQLTAWVFSVVVPILIIVVADDIGVVIPKWLFLLGFLIAVIPIQLLPDIARRRLARGLASEREH